jgi:hypothetical protein
MNSCYICWFSHIFLPEILSFKGLTARRLYKSFGVKGLINYNTSTTQVLLRRMNTDRNDHATRFMIQYQNMLEIHTKESRHKHPSVYLAYEHRNYPVPSRFRSSCTDRQTQTPCGIHQKFCREYKCTSFGGGGGRAEGALKVQYSRGNTDNLRFKFRVDTPDSIQVPSECKSKSFRSKSSPALPR